MLKIYEATDPAVEALLAAPPPDTSRLAVVEEIIAAVRARGDDALCAFTARFDRVELDPASLRVAPGEIQAAYEEIPPELLEALRLAKERILAFHARQVPQSWFEAGGGVFLGQVVRPLARVGIYVPGGTAAYPSSVLMNALPARAAGVPEIVMCTPPRRDGTVAAPILVAAAEAGVTEIYRVGGAQAVAAMAYGTESIRPVDKIVGPGNIYVTLAKQRVYGRVAVDMPAGPSEVAVVADATADPAWVAADLLAQAEHDTLARCLVFTPSRELAQAVADEVRKQAAALPRREYIQEALENFGGVVVTRDLAEAVRLANLFAPEHLELMVDDPLAWLGSIENAGAVFLGPYAPVPVGDYAAGPNHVLPTGGAARFASALGTDAFIKRINVTGMNAAGLAALADAVVTLAEAEGLTAHAAAVRARAARRERENGCGRKSKP
ncbi:MAG: histidinol dehydrogenase [Desulfotomaculales bacterium]